MQRPPLDPGTFRALCAYAMAHAILPDDVVRLAAGLKPREPFLIDYSAISPYFRHATRYLSILSELYRGSPQLFETVAPKIRGTIRVYFSKIAAEIESTGSSNWATQIPGTPWFASINNSDEKRAQTISQLMQAMNFSPAYTEIISRLCMRGKLPLPSSYSAALAKLPSP